MEPTSDTNKKGSAVVAATTTIPTTNNKKQKMGRPKKDKKPPNAPKRFQSSFIFFSKSKHKEIRKQKEQDKKDGKVLQVTTKVSK